MARTSIEIESFVHQNPIPAATRIGPLIESSIIPAFNDGTRDLPENVEDQISNLFLHMGNMLTAAGATWDDMAKITFFVAGDADVRGSLNGPWEEKFPNRDSRPSRHTLSVAGDRASISCVFTAYVEG